MCWFKKKPVITPSVEVPLVLPHPEEPQNPNATVQNIHIDAILDDWMIEYKVPETEYSYWRNQIDIKLFDFWPDEQITWGATKDTPAFALELDGKRHLYCLAKWFNAGVIAHEQAHNSYALLTEGQKLSFQLSYNYYKDNDKMIQYLYSINKYGLTNDIEGHAEIYRYGVVPEALRYYYPKLI